MVDYTTEEIDHIAVEVGGGYVSKGGFLQTFFHAWQRADPYNKEILQRAATTLIEKYDLQKYLNYAYGKDHGKRMVEAV